MKIFRWTAIAIISILQIIQYVKSIGTIIPDKVPIFSTIANTDEFADYTF